MSDSHHSDSKFWIGLFAGGIIGAMIVAVLGTKEGKKAAKMLEDKGKDALDVIQDQLATLEEKGKEIVRESKALEEHVIDKIENKKGELIEQTAEKLDDALAHIEQIQERGRETTANIRQRLFKNLPKKTT